MDEDTAKKSTKFFGLSRNVLAMGLVSFLNDMSSDMIFPFIPIFLTSVLGATATFVGFVEGIADATASILKLFSGRLSDFIGRRKPFVVFGYSLSAIAKPILAAATSPWHVLAVRFIDRVGKGMRDAPRDALLSLSTEKKNVGRAFGFHRAADTLGAAFGPLVAFVVLPHIHNNLRTLFLFSFVASVIAVVILKTLVKEVKNHTDTIVHPKLEFKYFGVPFIIFLAASTIFALGRASDALLLLRARGMGFSLMLIPILYFVYNITLSLVSTPIGVLSDRFGHRNTFMLGMLFFSGVYFMFAQVQSAAVLWLLFPLYGFATAFTEGVGRAIIVDLVVEEWRATAYGMYNAFTGIALLPASLVFGYLWDRYGISVSFQYGAILGLIAFVIFLFLRVRNHRLGTIAVR